MGYIFVRRCNFPEESDGCLHLIPDLVIFLIRINHVEFLIEYLFPVNYEPMINIKHILNSPLPDTDNKFRDPEHQILNPAIITTSLQH